MFARDFEICRLFGIPLVVGFDVVFLMLFIALSCGNLVWGLLFSLVLVVSIVLHELGHALTARLFRVQVREIRIGMLGGCAELVGRLWRPGHQVAVSLAGPLVNLLVAGALYALALFAPVPPRLAGLLGAAIWTNLVLGGFNLIPGFPLDGGRIFVLLIDALVFLIIRRHIPDKWQERLVTICFILLLVLMALIMFQDVVKTATGSLIPDA